MKKSTYSTAARRGVTLAAVSIAGVALSASAANAAVPHHSPRLHLGLPGPMRKRRQLGHQHRKRIRGRAAIQRQHVGGLWRHGVCGQRQP